MKIGVYAGSFDPLTNGHLWVIQQGVKIFDKLYIALGANPHKNYTFSNEDRLLMLQESLADLSNITIAELGNYYLVEYAQKVGANYMLRGIRSSTDYEYERAMRYINQDLTKQVETIFLMPPRHIAEISSSMVKSLVGPVSWQSKVARYVPEPVLEKLTLM